MKGSLELHDKFGICLIVNIVIKKIPQVALGREMEKGEVYSVSEGFHYYCDSYQNRHTNSALISVKVITKSGKDVWLIPGEYEILKQ